MAVVDHARPGKPRHHLHPGPLAASETERVPRPVMLDIDGPDAPVPLAHARGYGFATIARHALIERERLSATGSFTPKACKPIGPV